MLGLGVEGLDFRADLGCRVQDFGSWGCSGCGYHYGFRLGFRAFGGPVEAADCCAHELLMSCISTSGCPSGMLGCLGSKVEHSGSRRQTEPQHIKLSKNPRTSQSQSGHNSGCCCCCLRGRCCCQRPRGLFTRDVRGEGLPQENPKPLKPKPDVADTIVVFCSPLSLSVSVSPSFPGSSRDNFPHNLALPKYDNAVRDVEPSRGSFLKGLGGLGG